MEQTWRWFGPADPIPLAHIRQAGATGIVTSLHHIPAGEAWTETEVKKRLDEIEAAGLRWSVVESIPVPEAIKLRRGDFQAAIDTWKQSLTVCANAGKINTPIANPVPIPVSRRSQFFGSYTRGALGKKWL